MDNFGNAWWKYSIRIHLRGMIQGLIVSSSISPPAGLVEEVYRLRELEPTSRRRSTRGGWSSTTCCPNIDQFPELGQLLLDVKAHSFWFNINPQGSSNEWHNHTGYKRSGVLYLQAVSGSGDIQFDFNRCVSTETLSVSPESGLLIVFPSDIYHRVEINTSMTDRVCLVFNSHL